MKFLWAIYGVGVVLALWRTDAGWLTRIALALLWPVGPMAFLITVAILLGASLIAFPVVAGLIAATVAAGAWWLVR